MSSLDSCGFCGQPIINPENASREFDEPMHERCAQKIYREFREDEL